MPCPAIPCRGTPRTSVREKVSASPLEKAFQLNLRSWWTLKQLEQCSGPHRQQLRHGRWGLQPPVHLRFHAHASFKRCYDKVGLGSGLVPRTLEAIFTALNEERCSAGVFQSFMFDIAQIRALSRSLTLSALRPSMRQPGSRALATRSMQLLQPLAMQIHNERIRDLLAPATPKEAPAWQASCFRDGIMRRLLTRS